MPLNSGCLTSLAPPLHSPLAKSPHNSRVSLADWYLSVPINLLLQDGSLQCPSCKTIYGEKTGTQPKGKMEIYSVGQSLPGHSDCGTIQIVYIIPPGIQVGPHSGHTSPADAPRPGPGSLTLIPGEELLQSKVFVPHSNSICCSLFH